MKIYLDPKDGKEPEQDCCASCEIPMWKRHPWCRHACHTLHAQPVSKVCGVVYGFHKEPCLESKPCALHKTALEIMEDLKSHPDALHGTAEYINAGPTEALEDKEGKGWEERYSFSVLRCGKCRHSKEAHRWGDGQNYEYSKCHATDCGCSYDENDTFTTKEYQTEEITFITTLLAQVAEESREKALEEAIALSDRLEDGNTKFDEWRAFKGFRNALRDLLKKN